MFFSYFKKINFLPSFKTCFNHENAIISHWQRIFVKMFFPIYMRFLSCSFSCFFFAVSIFVCVLSKQFDSEKNPNTVCIQIDNHVYPKVHVSFFWEPNGSCISSSQKLYLKCFYWFPQEVFLFPVISYFIFPKLKLRYRWCT